MKRYVLFIGIVFAVCYSSDGAPVKPSLQVIPPLPGYVPVFIRKGDQPLEEINEQLAAAFRALEAKSAHEKATPSHGNTAKDNHHKQVGNNKISDSREIIIPVIIQTGLNSPDFNTAEMLKKKIMEKVAASDHIQKIPRNKN